MQTLSINPEVQKLHAAYNEVTGFDLPLMPSHERHFLEAHLAGLTPQMLKDVIIDRQKRIAIGVRNRESLYLRNLVGSEEMIAETINESCAIAAMRRARAMEPGRAEVLRATGRSAEPTPNPPQASREVIANLAAELRKAVA